MLHILLHPPHKSNYGKNPSNIIFCLCMCLFNQQQEYMHVTPKKHMYTSWNSKKKKGISIYGLENWSSVWSWLHQLHPAKPIKIKYKTSIKWKEGDQSSLQQVYVGEIESVDLGFYNTTPLFFPSY